MVVVKCQNGQHKNNTNDFFWFPDFSSSAKYSVPAKHQHALSLKACYNAKLNI